jgi:hypothetical protein
MSVTTRNCPRIRVPNGLNSPTRTPLSNYLDEYIAAEVQCMVREIGGWRRGRNITDQNRQAMEWIEKNAAQFRVRWNRTHGMAHN